MIVQPVGSPSKRDPHEPLKAIFVIMKQGTSMVPCTSTIEGVLLKSEKEDQKCDQESSQGGPVDGTGTTLLKSYREALLNG